MRELGLAGLIAIAFGLVPWWTTGELSWFSWANFALGGAALLGACALVLSRMRGASEPVFRRALVRSLAGVALTVLAAVVLVRAASWTGIRWDLSFDTRFELSDATLRALEDLDQVEASLYFDALDPRVRSTRHLLRTLAATGHFQFTERRLDDHPDEEDCFAIGSSNTVVLRMGDGPPCQSRFQTVERPSEGTLYEALYRLRSFESRVLYVSRGAGEGDLGSDRETGFSGLAEALLTEGYRVRQFVLAARPEIPEDASAVLLLSPRRPLQPDSHAALGSYLERGGRLVVFLDPAVDSGLTPLLADWGISSLDAAVVDPASGSVEGDAPGVNPLAYNYASRHPMTTGLGPNRMTFFRGARSFTLRKPRPEDRLEKVVFASPRSWLSPDLSVLDAREAPQAPPGAQRDYHPLVVAGRFPRSGGEARIVVFGDGDLASNRYLRTLYNLDLVLNAVHWATDREPDITLRPKLRSAVSGGSQFPIPLQNTLTMFQSLGLLLPELLLLAGAIVWVRSRSA